MRKPEFFTEELLADIQANPLRGDRESMAIHIRALQQHITHLEQRPATLAPPEPGHVQERYIQTQGMEQRESREGKLREAGKYAAEVFKRFIDADRMMRGKMDERDFIRAHNMTMAQWKRLDAFSEEKRAYAMLEEALADGGAKGGE